MKLFGEGNMLVYKHQNIFSALRTKQRCAECKNINSCYWHRTKKNPGMEACSSPKFDFHNPEIVPGNANWMLFQLGRDIDLTKGVTEQSLNRSFINSILSPSLQHNHQPNIVESRVYIALLKAFLDYIVEFEKEVKHDREQIVTEIKGINHEIELEKEVRKKIQLESKLKNVERRLLSLDGEIGRFLGSIIETTIKVDNKQIFIFSESVDLIDAFKKVAETSQYTFVQEKDCGSARKWLAQITKEN